MLDTPLSFSQSFHVDSIDSSNWTDSGVLEDGADVVDETTTVESVVDSGTGDGLVNIAGDPVTDDDESAVVVGTGVGLVNATGDPVTDEDVL